MAGLDAKVGGVVADQAVGDRAMLVGGALHANALVTDRSVGHVKAVIIIGAGSAGMEVGVAARWLGSRAVIVLEASHTAMLLDETQRRLQGTGRGVLSRAGHAGAVITGRQSLDMGAVLVAGTGSTLVGIWVTLWFGDSRALGVSCTLRLLLNVGLICICVAVAVAIGIAVRVGVSIAIDIPIDVAVAIAIGFGGAIVEVRVTPDRALRNFGMVGAERTVVGKPRIIAPGPHARLGNLATVREMDETVGYTRIWVGTGWGAVRAVGDGRIGHAVRIERWWEFVGTSTV
jgi:hypothetical protein